MLANIEELSAGALHNCSAALVAMVSGHTDLCASDGSLDKVLQAMSNIVSHGKSLPVSISRQVSRCIDQLTATKGSLLVPGESVEMVMDKIRFLSSSGFASQASRTIYGAPQT